MEVSININAANLNVAVTVEADELTFTTAGESPVHPVVDEGLALFLLQDAYVKARRAVTARTTAEYPQAPAS